MPNGEDSSEFAPTDVPAGADDFSVAIVDNTLGNVLALMLVGLRRAGAHGKSAGIVSLTLETSFAHDPYREREGTLLR